MIFFLVEAHVQDREFISALKRHFPHNLSVILGRIPKDGGWNSLLEKVFKFWSNYFLLSFTALKKSRKGDLIVTWQVFVGVVTGLLLRISHVKRELVVLSFIYRPRGNRLIDSVRYFVTRTGLSSATKIICYSRFEQTAYTELFKLKNSTFLSTELGKTYDVVPRTDRTKDGYIFSAGQSNRDYDVLIKSVQRLSVRVLIATTNRIEIPEELKSRVDIRPLHAEEFQSALARSLVTVIPLLDTGYSSGQVVLVNAMAAGRCVILTEACWSKDYVVHGENAWLVPAGDENKMAEGIRTLMEDDDLRTRMERNARKTYEDKLNGRVFGNRVAEIINA